MGQDILACWKDDRKNKFPYPSIFTYDNKELKQLFIDVIKDIPDEELDPGFKDGYIDISDNVTIFHEAVIEAKPVAPEWGPYYKIIEYDPKIAAKNKSVLKFIEIVIANNLYVNIDG